MTEKWIIALDQGTSSCRAMAIDQQGRIRAQQSKLFSPKRPAKGLSYYEADEVLATQVQVLNQILDEIGPERAAAIAVCSQRSTVVLWNRDTGQAVAPVLTWEDGRSLEQSNQAAISQEEIHQQTGLFKTPFFSAPKVAWCLQNCPAATHALEKGKLAVAPVASYLIWHLTGGQVFATDPTLAQRTLLWDIHTGAWSDSLCRIFGVSPHCLPEIRPSATDYGTYVYKGISIPICTCVADQQASATYQSLSKGHTLINYGTGAFVLYHTGTNLTVLPGTLSSVAALGPDRQQSFLLEGPIFSAGSLLQYLRTQGVQFENSNLDDLCEQATNIVKILPAFGGLGAPYWDYTASFVAQDVSPSTTASDWLAGALEAIAGRVADVIYYLQAHSFPMQYIAASGGLSNSRYLLQTQADFLGHSIHIRPQTESTVLGTAMLAALQLGWDMTAWSQQEHKVVSPEVSSQISQKMYQDWHQFVQQHRAVHP